MEFSAQLAQAERLIAVGKLDEAKAVIRGVLAQDKRNAEAWYLVSRCVDDPKAKAEALRRALLSNPNYTQAKREYDAMDGDAVLRPPSQATQRSPSRKPLPLLLVGGGVISLVAIVVVLVLVLRQPGTPAPTVESLVPQLAKAEG